MGAGAGAGGDPLRPRRSWIGLPALAGWRAFQLPPLTFAPSGAEQRKTGAPGRRVLPVTRAQALWPPQWVGPWAFPALERTLAWGSWGMLSHRQPPPAPLLFLFLPPHRGTDTKQRRITDAQTPSCLCAWLQRRMRGPLARADSHRQSILEAEIINNENCRIIVAWWYWSFCLS